MHSALRESEKSLKKDLKDFVRSTAKGTETKLIKELKKEIAPLKSDVKLLQVTVTAHSVEMKQNRTEIQRVRTELKDEMHGMEERLGDKIDKKRLSSGRSRITYHHHRRSPVKTSVFTSISLVRGLPSPSY